jgi:DHA2 family multidrug resistance protein
MTTAVVGNKAAITAAAMIAALMAFLDISIVNVALSDIRASFGTPIDQLGWITTGYMTANVIVIPTTGWLQRRLGYRRALTAAIVVFVVASALCGTATSLPSLVTFRVLQGIGGGAIIPIAQSVLLARYPRTEHGRASALIGIGSVAGPLLGPTVGGHLIDVASWHWIFLVNIPLGLLAAVLCWTHIREPGFVPTRDPVDRYGIALLVIGMACLQYVLEEGHRERWFESGLVVALSAAAAITLVTFVVHERETRFPIVDLSIFRNRSYRIGSAINALFGVSLFSGSYLFSLYCGTIIRYDAIHIGLLFMVPGVVQLLTMPLVGRLSRRVDLRLLLGFGISMMAFSLWLTSRMNGQAGFWDLAVPQLVRFLSPAFIFIPLMMLTLSSLTEKERGNATGLFNVTRELGGSIGTAWLSTQLDARSHRYADSLASHIDVYSARTASELVTLRNAVGGLGEQTRLRALAIIEGRIEMQALSRAFNDCFLFMAMAIASGLLLVALLGRHGWAAPPPRES